MNFVATGPVTPPLASGPWQGTQKVTQRSRPSAIDAADARTGFGCFAATSRCSLGRTRSPPRGTTPAGIRKTRSPGMILAVSAMLWVKRTTTAVPISPPAAATIRSVRMKTHFTAAPRPLPPRGGSHAPSRRARAPRGWPPRSGGSVREILRAAGAEDLTHRAAAPGRHVDGHPEAVVGETRVEARARREPRQPPEQRHAEH